MKKTFFLLLITSGLFVFSQNLPCKFRWDNVKTVNGERTFVTPVKDQQFADPCISFAFTSAIETMYMKEYNLTNPFFGISEAYLDVKVYNANMLAYKNTLEDSFKIPFHRSIENLNPENLDTNCRPDFNIETNFPNKVNKFFEGQNSMAQNDYQTNANCCVELGKDFLIYNNSGEDRSINKERKKAYTTTNQEVGSCGVLITKNDYVTVGAVNSLPSILNIDTEDLNQITIENIKETIIEIGPIVMKVYGPHIPNFKNYDDDNLYAYHAYTIIGWENSDTGTKWIIKDSWQGIPINERIFKTNTLSLSNNFFLNLIANESVELYTVSNIIKNDTPNNETSFIVDRSLQCNDDDIEPNEVVLNNIDVEVDHIYIGGYMYSKFWINSNTPVESWTWGIEYPNNGLKRSQIDTPINSEILISPTNTGIITVFVNAYKDGVYYPKERTIFLSNSNENDNDYD